MNTARYLMSCINYAPAVPVKVGPTEELLFEVGESSSNTDWKDILFQVHKITKTDGSVYYRFTMKDVEAGELVTSARADTLEPVVKAFEKASRQKYDPTIRELLFEVPQSESKYGTAFYSQIVKITHLVDNKAEYQYIEKRKYSNGSESDYVVESGTNLAWIARKFEKNTKIYPTIPELQQDESGDLPEVSKEVAKQLEVFAKSGGKTSEPAISTLTEALQLCGWTVDASIWKCPAESNKISFYDISIIHDAINLLWNKYNKKVKTKLESVTFYNRRDEYGNRSGEEQALIGRGAIQELIDNGIIVLGKESNKIGTVQARTFVMIPYQEYYEAPEQVFKFIDAQVVLPALTITAPNGKSIEIKCYSDTKVKTSTMWKFFYDNGLQEAAQAVILKGFSKPLTEQEILIRSRSGICPVCMRYIERRDDGRIMRHGWRSYGWLMTQPPCFGWEKLPWEKSPSGAIEYYHYLKDTWLPSVRETLKSTIEFPPDSYPNPRAKYYTDAELERKGISKRLYRGKDEEWANQHKIRIASIEGEIREVEWQLPRILKRIESWKEQPFWFELHADEIKALRKR